MKAGDAGSTLGLRACSGWAVVMTGPHSALWGAQRPGPRPQAAAVPARGSAVGRCVAAGSGRGLASEVLRSPGWRVLHLQGTAGLGGAFAALTPKLALGDRGVGSVPGRPVRGRAGGVCPQCWGPGLAGRPSPWPSPVPGAQRPSALLCGLREPGGHLRSQFPPSSASVPGGPRGPRRGSSTRKPSGCRGGFFVAVGSEVDCEGAGAVALRGATRLPTEPGPAACEGAGGGEWGPSGPLRVGVGHGFPSGRPCRQSSELRPTPRTTSCSSGPGAQHQERGWGVGL